MVEPTYVKIEKNQANIFLLMNKAQYIYLDSKTLANVCYAEKRTKYSSIFLLHLVRFSA